MSEAMDKTMQKRLMLHNMLKILWKDKEDRTEEEESFAAELKLASHLAMIRDELNAGDFIDTSYDPDRRNR